MTQPRACIMYNIRGMDGRGWGVGDGLPMVSRVSLQGLSIRNMDGRGCGGWGWVANGQQDQSLGYVYDRGEIMIGSSDNSSGVMVGALVCGTECSGCTIQISFLVCFKIFQVFASHSSIEPVQHAAPATLDINSRYSLDTYVRYSTYTCIPNFKCQKGS